MSNRWSPTRRLLVITLPVDAGRIGPVQVLEDEHDGDACRDHVQCVAQLSQHPVLGCADSLLLKLGACATGSEGGRELEAPRWRVTPENRRHPGPARAGHKRVERVEER